MVIDLGALFHGLVTASAFSLLGIVFFGFAIWLMTKVVPFSIRKEIEEDQNVALGVVMGSVLIGLAIIVAAAIHG